MKSQNALRDFADWRLQIYKVRPRESVRFFRGSLDRSMVWMLVMRGHFDGNPPTVGECQSIGRCSPLTARKLISDAVVLGFLELKTDSVDHRKRTVCPTERTIREYVDMVQGYAEIFERIGPDMRRLELDPETTEPLSSPRP
jgi:hypothetical protein